MSSLVDDTSTPEEQPAKRRKMSKIVPLSDLAADEFIKMMNKYREGPLVIITVEEHKYKIPKDRICDSSTFFNSAFNGDFKESQDLELKLEETTPKTFELVIQWIYIGKLSLQAASNGAIENLNQLLAFVKLADRLKSHGSTGLCCFFNDAPAYQRSGST